MVDTMIETERPATPDDGAFMRRALALAARGWGQTAPNPMVGAVVVRDGAVVGEGWHTRYGDAHAEVDALRAAGERARGATLYVTLEPCNHHGKTPPCTEAILGAGVRRVVAATADPNPVAGGGADRLRAAGLEVLVGTEQASARELNAAFFHALESDRPFVQLKLALSLDGALADGTRRPGWLSGAGARGEVHRLRAGSDAVAVGIGTALADDPMLTVRDVAPPRVPPVRIVFDTSARLPLDSRLVRSAREAPVLVVCWAPDPTHAAALEHAGVELLHAASLAHALRALRARGIRSVLAEGGAGLASALLQEAQVDRLIIFRAPILLGGGSLNAFGGMPPATIDEAPRWRILESRRFGDDEMTVYTPPD
ncbi:MAG TPA: bifunctional diaminohydroxyphosphoribosylaminopyrimidine deaminase/5-amino-6-(5-phosphoribosylamino)uracil reductase RibD [Gemmatimonadaceae bacterium]|nr:bifunctional diaminohydroxyphosphoribosylaminopyrimidine deaminase/5-amino-6-(5-phosphoribosylamino)uracil reductase RibD [Gemmatimonadaceae bacterium]